MSEYNQIQKSSIQVSLRLSPEWHEELKSLAKRGSLKYQRPYSIQDMVRIALDIAHDKLLRGVS